MSSSGSYILNTILGGCAEGGCHCQSYGENGAQLGVCMCSHSKTSHRTLAIVTSSGVQFVPQAASASARASVNANANASASAGAGAGAGGGVDVIDPRAAAAAERHEQVRNRKIAADKARDASLAEQLRKSSETAKRGRDKEGGKPSCFLFRLIEMMATNKAFIGVVFGRIRTAKRPVLAPARKPRQVRPRRPLHLRPPPKQR